MNRLPVPLVVTPAVLLLATGIAAWSQRAQADPSESVPEGKAASRSTVIPAREAALGDAVDSPGGETAEEGAVARAMPELPQGPGPLALPDRGDEAGSLPSAPMLASAGGHTHADGRACAACEASNRATPITFRAGPGAPAHVALGADLQGALFRANAGGAIEIPLPGGGRVEGFVDRVREENGQVIAVEGRTGAERPGEFFFQQQTMPGVAGSLVGVVRFGDGGALRVEPDGAGKPVLVERALDDVICTDYHPVPPEERLAIAAAQEEAAEAARPAGSGSAAALAAAVPSLQSRPGAVAVALLDYNGQNAPHMNWGNAPNIPAPNVTEAEIQEVWRIVAEDYAPFQINVTTDEAVYNAAPQNARIRCIMTTDSSWYGAVGGVAYLQSFNWTGDTPCWSFYVSGKAAAEVASHEIGHTLRLYHDGSSSTGYYAGHGSGATGWAPIMGVGYYQPVVQWSKGEYANANNLEDDLAIISGNNNQLAYRADDHGADAGNATPLTVTGGTPVSVAGVIERSTDIDAFSFTLGGSGSANFTAAPKEGDNANLDLVLDLVNSAGAVVASANPLDGLGASITASLPAGSYRVRVRGTGKGDPLTNGYSAYASLGQYQLTGTVQVGGTAQRWVAGTEQTPLNLARLPGAVGSQSSTYYGCVASRAFDGVTASDGAESTISHTAVATTNSWLRVDFGAVRPVGQVRLWNRPGQFHRLSNYRISLLDANGNELLGQDFHTGGTFSGATETWTPSTVVNASAVRVQLKGTNNEGNGIINLVEFEVFGPKGANLTQSGGASASQKTTYGWGGAAARGIDGNTNMDWYAGSITHTDATTANNWWEVNLGRRCQIDGLVLWNRTGFLSRLSNFRVTVYDGSAVVHSGEFFTTSGNAGPQFSLWATEALIGDRVRVELIGPNREGNTILSLAECQVFGREVAAGAAAPDSDGNGIDDIEQALYDLFR